MHPRMSVAPTDPTEIVRSRGTRSFSTNFLYSYLHAPENRLDEEAFAEEFVPG